MSFEISFALAYTYKRSTGTVLGRYLSALGERRILASVCEDGAVLVPAAEADPRTGRDTTGEVDVGPGGVVTTWTWVSHPRPGQPFSEPFAYAMILLDGATFPLLHVVRGAEPKAGQRVTAVFAESPQGDARDLLAFEAAP